jgi:dihydrolipoamide dehydrogenase
MYDLGIIGAGSAGYVAAEYAAKEGMKVVMFDKRELGGVCLNEGCIPTKTLLYSAKLYENARFGEKYGIISRDVSYDFPAIMARKKKVVRKLVGGVGSKMKRASVEVVMAEAKISSRKKDHLLISSDGKDYACKNILLAAGAEAIVPPIKGLKKEEAVTSREILQIEEIPESINIVGGGVIGMEFASFFSSMGSSVAVFEMMDEILPGIDREIAVMFRKDMEKKGVEIYTSTTVTEIDGNMVVFENKNGKSKKDASKLLFSVGRRANTKGYGLEELGIELTVSGGIKIDDKCRTNIPNIYAAGDITGFSQLAHTASREGIVAVNNILGKKDRMRYNAVPSVVYSNPEISCVGLTLDEAREKGIDCREISLPMAYAGRFVIENEGRNGIAKAVVGNKYGEILGVHIYGNPGSEIIYGAAMAIETEMRITDMQEIIFPHPTVSEIIHELLYT